MNNTGDADYTETLAEIYDAFKASDNYKIWSKLVIDHPIRQLGNGGHDLLDVGCGTGKSSVAFAEHGYAVTACDASEAMLDIARAKHPTVATFHLADMRDLPESLGRFDVIHWMDDVANHLLSRDDLHAALTSSAQLLRPGGVLVFDTNTLNAMNQFAEETHHITDGDKLMILWQGQSDRPTENNQFEARLTAFKKQPDGRWTRTTGAVRQRHYSYSCIIGALAQVGLNDFHSYGLPGGRAELITPANEREHTKVIYAARKGD